MTLASKQEIPKQSEEESREWTFKKLFPMKATVSLISKTFISPFDYFLAFLLLIVGVVEIVDEVSLYLWGITLFILAASVFERNQLRIQEPPKKPKKK